MCLAKAYLVKDSQKELIMEEVAAIEVGQRKLVLRTIFGEKREVAKSFMGGAAFAFVGLGLDVQTHERPGGF